MHSDVKKQRSSFLVALLFSAGDLQRHRAEQSSAHLAG
jgi:hypothetical protein